MHVKYDKKTFYMVFIVVLVLVAMIYFIFIQRKFEIPRTPDIPSKGENNIYDSYGPSDDESLRKKPEITVTDEVLDLYGRGSTALPDSKNEVKVPQKVLDSYGTNK